MGCRILESFFNSGNRERQQRGVRLKRLYTGCFYRFQSHTRDKTAPPHDRAGTEVFSETKSGPSRLSCRCIPSNANREIPNVQPEPESGPAESEPGSEARPAAGRRPEARPAAAGSEPSRQRPGPAGWPRPEGPLGRTNFERK